MICPRSHGQSPGTPLLCPLHHRVISQIRISRAFSGVRDDFSFSFQRASLMFEDLYTSRFIKGAGQMGEKQNG